MILRLIKASIGGRSYDEMCREGLTLLWSRVKSSPGGDGCVMTNPLDGQLEGVGWTVYVQIGDRGEDFSAYTLAEAILLATEKTEAWVTS